MEQIPSSTSRAGHDSVTIGLQLKSHFIFSDCDALKLLYSAAETTSYLLTYLFPTGRMQLMI